MDEKRLNISQTTKKLIINSLYGCLTSKLISIGDNDLGNSCTLGGQFAILAVNKFIINYVHEKYLSHLSLEECEKILIFNDTDSVGISLELISEIGIDICKDNKVTKRGYEIIDDISKAVNEYIIKWCKEEFNTNYATLDLKREKICDFGLYRGKKHYALHILDNEGQLDKDGNIKTKWHYSGIELAKASMTKELKEIGKKVIVPMIMERDKAKTDKLLYEAFEEFKKLPLGITCKIARLNTFDKYVKECDGFTPAKKMLKAGKAAYFYNLITKLRNMRGQAQLKQGEGCQILPVKKNNPYKIDCIAFRYDEFPEEFLDIFEVDYKTLFEKPFYDSIKLLYTIVGWECPIVTDEFISNTNDIFDDIFE